MRVERAPSVRPKGVGLARHARGGAKRASRDAALGGARDGMEGSVGTLDNVPPRDYEKSQIARSHSGKFETENDASKGRPR